MKRTYFNISLLSYLNHASGESDLFVDTDITTDFVGLPIVKGRAIKGLLRESMEEVMERSGTTKSITSYFGKSGYEMSTKSICFVSNAVIKNYRKTFLELYESDFTPFDVKADYTRIISQTKINKDGTAEDGSLRFTRVIDFLKQSELEFYIDSAADLEKDELFNSTILNLKEMGLIRNRGLGKIKLTKGKTETISNNSNPTIKIGKAAKINVELKGPVILPKQIGDQNTIYTEDCIRGNVVLGAMAYAYLKNNKVDADFLDAFVFGGLSFNDLTLNGAKHLPKNIASSKYKATKEYINFRQAPLGSFKKENGLINKNGDFKATNKMFSFHISRFENRRAGTSKKEDGAIFYLEYLVPFQKFNGNITETKKGLLQSLFSKIGTELIINIGASKATQYGEALFKISALDEKENERALTGNTAYLVLDSPCLVYNAYGFASLDIEVFKGYLPKELKVEPIAIKADFIQRFNAQWKSKTAKETTWSPGSAFLIKGDLKTLRETTYIGEKTHTGLGNYSLYSVKEMEELIQKLNIPTETPKNAPINKDSDFIRKLIKNKNLKAKKDRFILDASKTVVNSTVLANSLVENLRKQLKNQNNLKNWLKNVKEKIAGKKLTKAGWYNKLEKGAELPENEYQDFKMLWLEISKLQLIINHINKNTDGTK